MKLRSLEALSDPRRSPAIDFYRGLAALAVVFFHFEPFFPHGYLGVHLFFVISGFLVGGILIESYSTDKIDYPDFILKRGFKIWPSYYFFLLAGGIVAYFLYRNSHPTAYVPLKDAAPYIFFYRNYSAGPDHWCFDHTWTLCIEEHFYLLFPLGLMILLLLAKPSRKALYGVTVAMIAFGFLSKYYVFHYTASQNTNTFTHAKIDAFGWGILLYLLAEDVRNKKITARWTIALIGAALLVTLIAIDGGPKIVNYYTYVTMPTLVPLAFALLIFGTMQYSFRHFKPIRFLSYYSYNLYLWHPLLVYFMYDTFGSTWYGLLIYVSVAFAIAFVVTILVEEPFLLRRKQIIGALLRRSSRRNMST